MYFFCSAHTPFIIPQYTNLFYQTRYLIGPREPRVRAKKTSYFPVIVIFFFIVFRYCFTTVEKRLEPSVLQVIPVVRYDIKQFIA